MNGFEYNAVTLPSLSLTMHFTTTVCEDKYVSVNDIIVSRLVADWCEITGLDVIGWVFSDYKGLYRLTGILIGKVTGRWLVV